MIYAKRINPAQRECLEDYERICGLEPLWQEELDQGKMSFKEVWRHNVRHLEDILSEVTNINLRGTGA